MCNLYTMMRSRAEAASLGRAMVDRNHNSPPPPGIYPDYSAPVIVKGSGGREMRDMRWGLPSSRQALFEAALLRANRLRAKGQVIDEAAFAQMVRMEPDSGVTNVRQTTSLKTGKTNAHWRPWLGPANRCLVPVTSFAEPDQVGGSRQNIWFALDEGRPLAFFAGIWTPHACVRKIKTGWEECETFGFLTTESAEPVRTYHSKAMPVLLTRQEEWDLWMSEAPWEDVKHLQRPLPDGTLKVVAQGVGKDETLPL